MDCMKDRFQKNQILDGRFRTVAPLNHGSFGMVFLAEDMTTGQEVAIKCLTRPEQDLSAHDEGAIELDCHDALRYHPHLVNLVHSFVSHAHTYLVLEYCDQGDLYEAIRLERGPLQTEHVRRFMLQLISAVDHMHACGYYHRDIKPENIFLNNNGDMKLGDFGLATKSLWSYDSCVGSDRYMAPEQYDPAGVGYSPAQADIWSIGICLLNVLFSRNPFVTPTEHDVLFADYRRDRQSLFDIFPSLSQDTFEILSIAMALDPNKRDLNAVRQAVLRTLSFTTDDDSLDEFCTEDRDVVRASAHRQPLRTPSIQSPQMDGDHFPWAKALHTTPPRNLSTVPDAYEEDLFEKEKQSTLGESWFSGHATTPSIASVFDSAYGSLKSLAIRPGARRNPPQADALAVPSSLPTRPARLIPTMSSVFGKKNDGVAKSWSEMFDEDEEESDREREETEMNAKRQYNSRTWSQDSQAKLPVPPGVLTESKSRSSSNARRSRTPRPLTIKPLSGANENTPIAWRAKTPRRSPTQVPADKWSALGEKRRNRHAVSEMAAPETKKRSMTTGSRKRPSNQFDNWQRQKQHRPAFLNQDWRQQKVIDSSADESSDHEWVGGWHAFNL